MWGWLGSLVHSSCPWAGMEGEGGVDVKAHMRYVHYAVRTSCTRCETTFKELKNHMRHLLQVCGLIRSLSARPWAGMEGRGLDVKAHMRYVHYAVRTSCARCQTTFKELKNHMRHLLQV